jgi:hypothetical protein
MPTLATRTTLTTLTTPRLGRCGGERRGPGGSRELPARPRSLCGPVGGQYGVAELLSSSTQWLRAVIHLVFARKVLAQNGIEEVTTKKNSPGLGDAKGMHLSMMFRALEELTCAAPAHL